MIIAIVLSGIGQSTALLSGTSAIVVGSRRAARVGRGGGSGGVQLQLVAPCRGNALPSLSTAASIAQHRHSIQSCNPWPPSMASFRRHGSRIGGTTIHHATAKKSEKYLDLEPEDDDINADEATATSDDDDDDEEEKEYLNTVAGEDDADANEYFDKFISEALKEEEMIQNSNSNNNINTINNKRTEDDPTIINPSSESSSSTSSSSSSSSNVDDDASTVLEETKRMMEQQQQQINLLMKLVQDRQPLPTATTAAQAKIPTPPTTAAMAQQQQQQQQQQQKAQPSINVAPLKAMLFIDGTWLYYSLNTRDSGRDPIVPKFGRGWQNYYKVDW